MSMRLLKPPKFPLYVDCKFFDHCTGEEGGNRKDCSFCPLHPQAAPTVVLQCCIMVFLAFLFGLAFMAFIGG